MAQEKGLGESSGDGDLGWAGEYYKRKIPSAWDFQFGIKARYFLNGSVVALTR